MTCQVLRRAESPALAFDAHLPQRDAPCVLFLSGYRSDMNGSKASALGADARARGYNLVRFDYSGTGQSGGRFEDFAIGDWLIDAVDVFDQVIPQDMPVIVVGSSMGGWVALRLAMMRQVRAVVGIAAAPDFTREMYEGLNPEQRDALMSNGSVSLMGDVGRDPYYISRRMIEQGERLFLLGATHELAIPLHLLHGKMDSVVPWRVTAAIARAFPQASVLIDLIEDGDHSLSRPQDLDRLFAVIDRYRLS